MYKSPYPHSINTTIERYSLCSALIALGLLFISIVTVNICNKFKKRNLALIGISSFLLLTIIYWANDEMWVSWIVRALMPVAAFATLISIKEVLAKSTMLQKWGKISLPIYLVQTPILTVQTMVLPKLVNTDNWLVIIASQIIGFVLSYYVGLLLTKIPLTKRLLFPRTYKELLGEE